MAFLRFQTIHRRLDMKKINTTNSKSKAKKQSSADQLQVLVKRQIPQEEFGSELDPAARATEVEKRKKPVSERTAWH